MELKIKEINTIGDCFDLLGCKKPFLDNSKELDILSKSGNLAFEQLRKLLVYFEQSGIVDKFNEDILDKIVSEKSY
jgi:hypothetical protein